VQKHGRDELVYGINSCSLYLNIYIVAVTSLLALLEKVFGCTNKKAYFVAPGDVISISSASLEVFAILSEMFS
jgi:hypothetical protein